MSSKQVFLIGDSIRLGYCETVKKELADCAEVIFPAGNCRSTHFVIESLAGWLPLCRREDVAVVHFNCGHWDAAHFDGDETALTAVETYGNNIRKIIRRLKRYFPDAELIFATTTPMNPDPVTPDNRTTEEIRAYNREGIRAAEECGASINDLFALAEDWDSGYYADACHFTEEGYRILGETVAAEIRKRM